MTRGLRPISDHAHAKGVKILVWFEPERVTAGTWIAENHPDSIGIASSLLHHRQTRTTQEHYNQADQISASRRFNKLLTERRKEALKANRKGKLFQKKEIVE